MLILVFGTTLRARAQASLQFRHGISASSAVMATLVVQWSERIRGGLIEELVGEHGRDAARDRLVWDSMTREILDSQDVGSKEERKDGGAKGKHGHGDDELL